MFRMNRWLMALLWMAAALLGASVASAQPATARALSPIDYAQPANWLCQPAREQICTTDLDAYLVAADGTRTLEKFAAAANPAIDCFYVYPTVSHETTPYADMTPSAEIIHTARAQAGRLASRCRLFVPLYRQMTLSGLAKQMEGGNRNLDWDIPYADVVAAWDWYLAHDNHGRGVVLVGHSQGTILLQRLIQEQIDGKGSQKLLVAAFLGGDPALAVPQDATVGGTFKYIPLCSAPGQIGCAYPWGSYLAGDADPSRIFGRNPGNGLVGGCVNPAAPMGGKGALKAYLPRPAFAPDSDPAWIEVVGQLSARCVSDAQGNRLAITVESTRFADLLNGALVKGSSGAGWGLHRLDLNLTQGNILDDIDTEIASWMRR